MKKIFNSVMAIAVACVALVGCEDVPAPYAIPSNQPDSTSTSTVTPAGDGTAQNPYNVAAAIKACEALEQSSTSATYLSDEVYAKGIISQVESDFDTSYGNLTYYISDDGKTTTQVEVYRGKGLGGNKFTSAEDIKVGDTVIVCGKLQNWLGKVNEFTSGSKLVYLNGQTSSEGGNTGDAGTPKGTGTEADPYNVAAALKAAGALEQTTDSKNPITSDVVCTKGIIKKIDSGFNASYGNHTYYIADTKDGETTLEVYRGYGLNGDKFTSEDAISVGDTVIVSGKLVNFKGTLEYTNGSKLIYHGGHTASGGNNDGNKDDNTNTGVTVSGTTVTLTNAGTTAGATPVTLDLNAQSLTDATVVSSFTLSDGTKVEFDKGTNKTTPTFYTKTKGVRVYSNCVIKFTASKKIAKIVFTCDSYSGTNYTGNAEQTVTFSATGAEYTNKYSGADSGTQLRVQTISVYYAE